MDRVEDFLRAYGFWPKAVLADSKLRHCYIGGDSRGALNGWDRLDTIGIFGWGVSASHKTGERLHSKEQARNPNHVQAVRSGGAQP